MEGESLWQKTSARMVDCSQLCDEVNATGWDVDYQQVDRGKFAATFESVQGEHLLIAEEFFNRGLLMFGTPPPNTISILHNWGKRDRGKFQGKRVELHDVLFMRASDEGILRVPPGSHSVTISVSHQKLAEALQVYNGSELSNHLAESGSISFSPALIRQLRMIVSDAFHSPEDVKNPRCFEDAALQLLAQGLSEGPSHPSKPRRLLNRSQYVRIAREYIDSRLADDFGMGDVARAAGVSTRTLQSAFLSVLGVRPVEYIRKQRLSRTRTVLLDRRRSDEPIGKVAADHGLHHQSIFSRDYKMLFGELPSETIRARRPN